MSLKWHGDKISKNLKDRLFRNQVEGIEDIANKTRANLPRDTGRLASSVKTQHDRATLTSYWGSDLEYASDVEFGTQEQAPDGTWRRTVETNKQKLKETLKKE